MSKTLIFFFSYVQLSTESYQQCRFTDTFVMYTTELGYKQLCQCTMHCTFCHTHHKWECLAAAGVLKWKATTCVLCGERNHEQSSRKRFTYIYPNFLTWERRTPLSTKYDAKEHTPVIPYLYVHHEEWTCQKWLAKLHVLFFHKYAFTPSLFILIFPNGKYRDLIKGLVL